MTHTYKIKDVGNYRIELDSFRNEFEVSECDEEDKNHYNKLKSFPTLKNAETYIENRETRLSAGKIKRKEPLFVLHKDKYSNVEEEAKITSVDGNDVWIVVLKSKNRTKQWGLSDYMKSTDDNRDKLKQIVELEKKTEEVKKTIDRYSEAELKKHFEIDD